ncbi:MAG: PAS domain S-box protein [Dyadobacter sp.]
MHLKLLLSDPGMAMLLAHSSEFISLLNASFEITYRSPNATRITGWADEDKLGKNLKDLVHPEDAREVIQILHNLLRNEGLSISTSFRSPGREGLYMWIDATFTNLLKDPNVNAILCQYQDASATKNSSQLLGQSNSELHAYKYALDESSIVAVTDQKGIIKHVNGNFCRVSGYTADELIGQDHRIVNSSFHNKAYIRDLWTTIANGKVWKGELKNRAKNGHYYWVDTTIVPFLDERRKPYQYVAIRSDITGRKLGEEKLRQETNHLRLLESVITSTRDAILITEAVHQNEPGPRILFVNDAFTRMTGYSSEEILGQTPRIFQGPKTDRKELDRLRACLDKWESCEITVINYKKNGEEFLINLTVTPVADENGWYTHWISVVQDITESYKLEQEYDQIFHHAPDIICTVRMDGYFKKINPALSELLGYSEKELMDNPIVKFIHPDDKFKVMRDLQMNKNGGGSYHFENRCVTSSGQVKWLAWTSMPATENGLTFAIAKNITEKKELEELLDKVTRLARIGGWEIDLLKGSVFWSAVAKEIHEVETDYEPNMESAIDFYRQDARTKIANHLELAMEKCSSFDMEAQIVTAKNNVKWIRVIGEPEFEMGKCVRIRGSFQDINDRKTAELIAVMALKEKNSILESIGDAFFAVDKNWVVNYWNKEAERLMAQPKDNVLNRNLWVVFPDAVGSASYMNLAQALKTNEAVHFEYFYPPFQKWYEASVYPSHNGLSVYFKDVTERKRITSALEESERNYSSLFQLSPLPKWVFDLQTLQFLEVNQAAIKNYGYSEVEFLNMTINNIRPTEDLQQVRNPNNITDINMHLGIYRHVKKDGSVIQVDIQSNPVQFNGKPAKLMIAKDMTERYHYVKAIEDQNNKLREIAYLQSHVVRAPLARIMGLVSMLQDWDTFVEDREKLLDYLLISARELDDVVKNIANKTCEKGFFSE